MKQPIPARPIENPLARFVILGLASGLGLGYAPVAPGTFGSLLGIPLGILFLQWPMWFAFIVSFVLLIPTSWISGRAGLHWGNSDSGRIVIDEVLGQAITLLGLRYLYLDLQSNLSAIPLWLFVVGFLAFRLLDIVKPFPARALDRRSTGFAVMADDVVAGLYGALILRGICLVWERMV